MIKSDGNFLEFFSRPIAASLGVLTIAVWVYPIMTSLKGNITSQNRL
jgi:putative tricarboxylic transport membrane protein